MEKHTYGLNKLSKVSLDIIADLSILPYSTSTLMHKGCMSSNECGLMVFQLFTFHYPILIIAECAFEYEEGMRTWGYTDIDHWILRITSGYLILPTPDP